MFWIFWTSWTLLSIVNALVIVSDRRLWAGTRIGLLCAPLGLALVLFSYGVGVSPATLSRGLVLLLLLGGILNGLAFFHEKNGVGRRMVLVNAVFAVAVVLPFPA